LKLVARNAQQIGVVAREQLAERSLLLACGARQAARTLTD
jgi:hypothetical protein